MKLSRMAWLGLLLLCISAVSAQSGACPATVEEALNAIAEQCSDTGRNQACYGNINVDAQPKVEVSDFTFDAVGDIVAADAIARLQLSPMNDSSDEWGVALLKLQANLPDTLPGQNVTFVAFGDVALQNDATADQTPMQAFTLETRPGGKNCAEVPDNGVLVQTPDGDEQVQFTVNGVQMDVGSTVFLEAQASDTMQVTTIEGSASLNIGGELFPAIAGTAVQVALDENSRPARFPTLPLAYNPARFDSLPLRVLEREIEIAPALDRATLRQLRQNLRNGEPPCDLDGLPDCDDLPGFSEIEWDIRSNSWGETFAPGENCAVSLETASAVAPLCPEDFLEDFCEDNPDRFFCELSRLNDDESDDVDADDILEPGENDVEDAENDDDADDAPDSNDGNDSDNGTDDSTDDNSGNTDSDSSGNTDSGGDGDGSTDSGGDGDGSTDSGGEED